VEIFGILELAMERRRFRFFSTIDRVFRKGFGSLLTSW
jgi:hypothetical protein